MPAGIPWKPNREICWPRIGNHVKRARTNDQMHCTVCATPVPEKVFGVSLSTTTRCYVQAQKDKELENHDSPLVFGPNRRRQFPTCLPLGCAKIHSQRDVASDVHVSADIHARAQVNAIVPFIFKRPGRLISWIWCPTCLHSISPIAAPLPFASWPIFLPIVFCAHTGWHWRIPIQSTRSHPMPQPFSLFPSPVPSDSFPPYRPTDRLALERGPRWFLKRETRIPSGLLFEVDLGSFLVQGPVASGGNPALLPQQQEFP